MTARALESMGTPFYIVVEEKEYSDYAAVIDKKKILVLDPAYQRDYDTFDKLGDSKPLGSGPPRNFAWDHAIALGAEWHWCMDDNINGFYRYNRNLKVPVTTGTILRCMEDFVLRYTNVGMAGPNYLMFASRKSPNRNPFVLNTRIYSCNLIRNALSYRWRGRYNEDTDLSLRILKGSWATVLFSAFLQFKMPSGKVRGGLTDDFYKTEGTEEKSKLLYKMHPDVTELVWKFNRPHHQVDYRPFAKIRLQLKDGVEVKSGIDNYGMARQNEA